MPVGGIRFPLAGDLCPPCTETLHSRAKAEGVVSKLPKRHGQLPEGPVKTDLTRILMFFHVSVGLLPLAAKAQRSVYLSSISRQVSIFIIHNS